MNQRIYIGPTIPGLVEKNRIFRDYDKIPENIQQLADRDKCFARMFIPPDKLITARKELASKGSVLAVSYCIVSSGINNRYR